ncbi:MAG TPA: adenylyltransferase/cytidyltransferase family protein [Bacteroidia bacterium]|jgi:rfaE bifunctional protein nucleotidyltransferase chain/domain|nr:adenylyltransferase/cytidyltransferase family protein [Bacteroidia bacterium]
MKAEAKKLSALDIVQAKIFTTTQLIKTVTVQRFKSDKIVFTNGCFDIIHRGHIHYLAKAADLGNYLVVGVNSDASVKRLGKSTSRPLQDEQTRALVMASLHFVSAVVIFDEDTPLELIKLLKPEVLVKGADYDALEKDVKSKKYIVGSDVVKSYGGKVETIDYLENFSTTSIEEKISANAKATSDK